MPSRVTSLLATILLLPCCFAVAAAADLPADPVAWQAGWPAKAGPMGNFTPHPSATPLVEDLTMARLAWVSDTHLFGWAKTGTTGYRSAETIEMRIGAGAETPPGGWAGPIVGGGMVFGVTSLPTGELVETLDAVRRNPVRFHFDADDGLVAVDAATGALRWVAREEDGVLLAAGKRGGFGVAPVFHDGVVYWMGGSGRLYATRAEDGTRLWRSDFISAGRLAAREAARAQLSADDHLHLPPAPNWHTGLVVCDGVLVAPTFTDNGLAGIDLASGEEQWRLSDMVDAYATPSVWRSGDQEYLLTAMSFAALRLTEAATGTVLWQVEGLGRSSFNLAHSPQGVLVNGGAHPDGTETMLQHFGRFDYYRLSPAGAELAWSMAEDKRFYFLTGGDKNARIRPLIRDGLCYVLAGGYRDAGEREFENNAKGYYYIVDEGTGEILQTWVNQGKRSQAISEMTHVVGGNRLLTRPDHSHGPTHGGRHAFYQWRAGREALEVIGEDGAANALDLTDFATGYHCLMEVPIVDGRMFERLKDGRLACVDLRQPPGDHGRLALELDNGFFGAFDHAVPVRMTYDRASGRIFHAKTLGAQSDDVGLIGTRNGPLLDWNRSPVLEAGTFGQRIDCTVEIDQGGFAWPTRFELTVDGGDISGTWTRQIAALDEPETATGTVTAVTGPHERRVVATPWLRQQPQTVVGDNQPGVSTWVIHLDNRFREGINQRKSKPGNELVLYLDVDAEGAIRRLVGTAFNTTHSWLEIDPGNARLEGSRLLGTVVAVFNNDVPRRSSGPLNPAGSGVAMRLELEVDLEGGSGTYTASWGVPHTLTGLVRGTVR